MRVNDIVAKEVSLGIQAHNLTAGAEAWVYCHNTLLTHWCGKK